MACWPQLFFVSAYQDQLRVPRWHGEWPGGSRRGRPETARSRKAQVLVDQLSRPASSPHGKALAHVGGGFG
jgi:hypothetical protein